MDVVEDRAMRITFRVSIGSRLWGIGIMAVASFVLVITILDLGSRWLDNWLPVAIWSGIWLLGLYGATTDKLVCLDRAKHSITIIRRTFGVPSRVNAIPFEQVLGVHLDFVRGRPRGRSFLLRPPGGEWYIALATVGGRLNLGRGSEHLPMRWAAERIGDLVTVPIIEQSDEDKEPTGGPPLLWRR